MAALHTFLCSYTQEALRFYSSPFTGLGVGVFKKAFVITNLDYN